MTKKELNKELCKYDKKTPREHVLLRPDTYIGSIETVTDTMWVYDDIEEKIIKKEIVYNPGFFKIFDEILINARDAFVNDPSCDVIKINYDKENNCISVFNNGDIGIPVDIHPEHKILIPSMIFGEMLTSSNYNDNEERVTGGRNGVGATCCSYNTIVYKEDGKKTYAKDIKIGDKIIGDDGTIRNVLNTIRGNGLLYRVKQEFGDHYDVTKDHILTLQLINYKPIILKYNGYWEVYILSNNKIIKYKLYYSKHYKNEKYKNKLVKNIYLKQKYICRKQQSKCFVKKTINDKLNKCNNTKHFDKNLNRILEYNFNNNCIVDISVEKFLKLPSILQNEFKGVRGKAINYPYYYTEIEPYILGLWLGNISCMTNEILCKDYKINVIKYLENWSTLHGYELIQNSIEEYYIHCEIDNLNTSYDVLNVIQQQYNINKYKYIPSEYITNCKENRLLLLAGFIDINIVYKYNNSLVIYPPTRSNIIDEDYEHINNDIIYLARSLGFIVCKNSNKCCIIIYGNINEIPLLEKPLYYSKDRNPVMESVNIVNSTGRIYITPLHYDNYIGFELDKNKRFIINDFTVTHNCANIFSNKFIVQVDDSKRKKRFEQIWLNNMEIANEPTITKLPTKIKSSVKVIFYPDLQRFNITNLNNDHYNLFYRRAIDIAGTINSKIQVFFNDKKINVFTFKSYIELYYSPKDYTIFYDSTDRWSIGVIYSEQSEVISFVNGISTFKGGTHCTNVIDNIVKIILNDYVKKKDKDIKITANNIKDKLIFFISTIIVNPSFSSQIKDCLTTKADKFGSKYEPNTLFIKKIAKSGLVDEMLELGKYKEKTNLKKTDGKKQIKITGIPKLEDANKAGTKESYKCTLILTEGDSAKATAMAGLAVTGRDYFGVFPLKGKLLNVRDVTSTQLLANEEIKNLKIIIGLKHNEDYSIDEKFYSLRYNHILLLTDQDTDGSHIKGLVINMIHSLWPSLVKRSDFIQCLNTPIVKAIKGKNIVTFYNLSDYNDWKELPDASTFKIKYYKGLGTSTSAEAKEYFNDIDNKIVKYYYNSDIDKDDNAIILAFDKNKSDDRKIWLKQYDPKAILSYEQKSISYYDFIHYELIHFSNEDLIRSIPSVIDGLKPSQRKIVFGSFMRGLDKDEVKVSQLAGFVSDRAAYHHGEASLNGAIIGMAQNFKGSNNINILKPLGQFGCLAPNTPIILWNGLIKKAKDIKIYDELIGDDGNKRKVLQTIKGKDIMYTIKVYRNKHLNFTVNHHHILTLYFSKLNTVLLDKKNNCLSLLYFNGITIIEITQKFNNYYDINTKYKNLTLKSLELKKIYRYTNIIDISLKEFILLPKRIRNYFKLVSNYVPINWQNNDNVNIYDVNNIIENLHLIFYLPKNILYSNISFKVLFLRKLVNTYKISENKKQSVEISIFNFSKSVIKDIIFLINSLGYTTKEYNNILIINGFNLTFNQFKHDIKYNVYKFKIIDKGVNKFYGWQVDKNQRYLLGNFIITHNSILRGGKDYASPRYIWTMFDDLTTNIFNPLDNPILYYELEDGISVEPKYYVPIIPMVLINGCEGIGTGFSTKIPPFNPLDIINNIKNIINGKELIEMKPWWKNFTGKINKTDENNYEIYGNWTINKNKLTITELPIGEWTSNYKEFLEKILESQSSTNTKTKQGKNKIHKNSSNILQSYTDNNTDTIVHFELLFEDIINPDDIDKTFHLVKKYSTTNMHLYNKSGQVKKYNNVNEIIIEYYDVRLEFYSKRKNYLLDILKHQLELLNYKVKFILMIINNEIIINNRSKSEIENILIKNNFPKLSKTMSKTPNSNEQLGYDYLLSMPIHSLTKEKLQELMQQKNNKETEYNTLFSKSCQKLWLEELDILEAKYMKWIDKKN